MALNDFTGQNIQDTYQRVVQTDGTNLADGTGSLLPISFNGNQTITAGGLEVSGTLKIPGFNDVSSSLASAIAGGDNLGNHTATQNLNLNGNSVINLSTITDNQNLLIFSGDHQDLTIGDVNEESSGTFFRIQDAQYTFQFGSTGNPGATQLIADTIIARTIISSSEGKFSSLKGNSPLVIEPNELRISASTFNINSDVNLGKDEAGGDAKLLNAKDIPIIEPLLQGTTSSGVQGSGRTQFGGNHEVELYSLGATKIYSKLGSSNNRIGSYILIGSGSLPGGNAVANTDTDTIRFGSGSSGATSNFYDGTDTIIFNTSQGHITASGNISSSGNLTVNSINGNINGGTF